MAKGHKVWWIVGGVGLVVLAVLGSLFRSSQTEPTLDEFKAEFTVVMTEYDNLEFDPVPTRTGTLAEFRQALADNLRSGVPLLEQIMAELQSMRAPSDPPEAEELRKAMYEMFAHMRDDKLQMALAIENDTTLADSGPYHSRQLEYLRRIADLFDSIGMNSSGWRQIIESKENGGFGRPR